MTTPVKLNLHAKHFYELPKPIQEKIKKFLSPFDQSISAVSSKLFKKLMDDPFTWKKIADELKIKVNVKEAKQAVLDHYLNQCALKCFPKNMRELFSSIEDVTVQKEAILKFVGGLKHFTDKQRDLFGCAFRDYIRSLPSNVPGEELRIIKRLIHEGLLGDDLIVQYSLLPDDPNDRIKNPRIYEEILRIHAASLAANNYVNLTNDLCYDLFKQNKPQFIDILLKHDLTISNSYRTRIAEEIILPKHDVQGFKHLLSLKLSDEFNAEEQKELGQIIDRSEKTQIASLQQKIQMTKKEGKAGAEAILSLENELKKTINDFKQIRSLLWLSTKTHQLFPSNIKT